jgi:hypothetical protein
MNFVVRRLASVTDAQIVALADLSIALKAVRP